jgi:hypothetical protein
VDPNIKIEAFDNGNLVANDSKIKYNSELKVNVFQEYMDQTNQVFYKINKAVDYSSKWRVDCFK